jgi:hypothetical protein
MQIPGAIGNVGDVGDSASLFTRAFARADGFVDGKWRV